MCLFPQFLVLFAAVLVVTQAAIPPRRLALDIVNSVIQSTQYFQYNSVDQGDAESHYKSFELFVSLFVIFSRKQKSHVLVLNLAFVI